MPDGGLELACLTGYLVQAYRAAMRNPGDGAMQG